MAEKSGTKKSLQNSGKSPVAVSPSSSTRNSNSDEKTTGGQSTKLTTDVVLPQSKVRTIMKSSPEIDNIGIDSVFLITKATELFIDHLTTMAYTTNTSKGNKTLEYKNLSHVVHKENNLEFLRDIIPMKLPARVALAEVAKQTAFENKELLE